MTNVDVPIGGPFPDPQPSYYTRDIENQNYQPGNPDDPEYRPPIEIVEVPNYIPEPPPDEVEPEARSTKDDKASSKSQDKSSK